MPQKIAVTKKARNVSRPWRQQPAAARKVLSAPKTSIISTLRSWTRWYSFSVVSSDRCRKRASAAAPVEASTATTNAAVNSPKMRAATRCSTSEGSCSKGKAADGCSSSSASGTSFGSPSLSPLAAAALAFFFAAIGRSAAEGPGRANEAAAMGD